MRRSIGLALAAAEIGVLSWWALGLRFEIGFDSLQYQRMADAILRNGLAPWVLNPLSYIGMYPGSDNSGVPFLAASFSLAAGSPLAFTVAVYDAALLFLFGLGIFLLTRRLTGRSDVAVLAIFLGTLACGLFTTLSWSLDERSFNVALAPLFLLLVLPREVQTTHRRGPECLAVLGLMSFVMLASHANFLLLVPFIVLMPLIYGVIHHQYGFRQRRRASLLYFGIVALFPLLFLSALSGLGILNEFGLQYQLESSALFSGSSPVILMLNSLVFLGTRIGPANILFGLLGLLVLAIHRQLPTRGVLIGGLLLSGLVSLPIVLYSKDLLTPIFVVLGAVGIGGILGRCGSRRAWVIALSAVLVISGSVAFDSWNSARTERAGNALYWALPGITPEAQTGSVWLGAHTDTGNCAYGNNPAMLQQVVTPTGIGVCNAGAVDYLLSLGAPTSAGTSHFRVVFAGVSGVNPSNWFVSPDLDRMSSDFARLPMLHLDAGRALLREYHVSFVVVDLAKPFDTPTYAYQGTQTSLFFTELWSSLYPIYRTNDYAIFQVS